MSASSAAATQTNFVTTGSLATPRAHATATLLANGEVLVAGGSTASGAPLDTAELYNPNTGQWTAAGNLPLAVTDATASLLANGEVLVAGGLTTSGSTLAATNAAEIYNPQSNTWQRTGSLLTASFAAAATEISATGQVLYAGGLTSTSGVASAVSETYDAANGTWNDVGSLPVGVANETLTVLKNGDVLVAGGQSAATGSATAIAALYTPSATQWTPVQALPQGVTNATATLLPNGSVLVAGGENATSGAALNTTQLYNPSSETWTTASPLPVASYGATATSLASGDVLYAGGLINGSGTPTSAAYVYSASTGQWGATGSLLVGRGFATATRLSDGTVLIAGGMVAGSVTAESERTSTSTSVAFTSPSTWTTANGSAASFTIQTSGAPTASLSESGALPPGMNFQNLGNGTATISGTPTSPGVYDLTIMATNTLGSTVQHLVVTVSAPVQITSSAALRLRVGTAMFFRVTTTGTPTPRVSEQGALPSGLSLVIDNNGTAVLSGTPASNTGGTYHITLSASNGVGNAATQAFTIFVAGPSVPSRPTVPASVRGTGYWYTTSAGQVIGKGTARAMRPTHPQHPRDIVAIAMTPGNRGYYELSSYGGVFAYGDATWYGSAAGRHLPTHFVAMAVTPSGHGYYLVSAAGNVLSYGDAHFMGSTAGRGLPPIAGFALTPNGDGYWLTSIHGNVYQFGSASFFGSPARQRIPLVTAFAATPDGGGYWVVTTKGNVLSYGDARYYGSLADRPIPPVTDFVPTSNGGGYWVVTSRGNIFNFGNARFFGSSAASPLGAPVTGFAPDFLG